MPRISETDQKWTKTRQMGRWRFVFLRGAIGWGVPIALVWSAVMARHGSTTFFGWLQIALVIFPIGGLVWGLVMWRVNEKRYLAERGRAEL